MTNKHVDNGDDSATVPPMVRSRRAAPPQTEIAPDNALEDAMEPDSEANLIGSVGDITQLADPKYRDWTWWVYRMKSQDEIEKNPKSKPRAICTKILGPLDVIEIQSRFGGGVYEFWGYLDGTLRAKATHELEGARKVFDPTPATPTAATAATNGAGGGGTDFALLRIELAQLAKTVGEMVAKKPEAPQGLTVKDVVELVAMLNKMQGNANQPAPSPIGSDVVKEMVGLFKDGMEVRREADGGSEQSTLGIVIEKLAPALERVATAVLTRRPMPPRPPGPPRPVREAEHEVVGDPAAPAAAPPASVINHRWATAVEKLAEAVAQAQEPGDFAADLEGILNDQEIAVLRLATVEQVIAECGVLTETYPILKTEPARIFIEAVLSELRNPSEDPASPPA
jgi:hypothetical protein